MVSVEKTKKGLIAMNEALKKEAEAKVTEKLVLNDDEMWFIYFWYHSVLSLYY